MTDKDPWATPPNDSLAASGTPSQYAQPPAPSPPTQFPPGYSGAPTHTQKDWMGVTSLVLSLATVVLGITWIGGIILGHMGLAAAKRGEASNRSVALAGTIIGWVFGGLTILAIIGLVLFVFVFNVAYD